jgi:hypothetical protein
MESIPKVDSVARNPKNCFSLNSDREMWRIAFLSILDIKRRLRTITIRFALKNWYYGYV